MYDLRHGLASTAREGTSICSLASETSLFEERCQDSNINYFIILEVMVREKMYKG